MEVLTFTSKPQVGGMKRRKEKRNPAIQNAQAPRFTDFRFLMTYFRPAGLRLTFAARQCGWMCVETEPYSIVGNWTWHVWATTFYYCYSRKIQKLIQFYFPKATNLQLTSPTFFFNDLPLQLITLYHAPHPTLLRPLGRLLFTLMWHNLP